MMMIICFPRLNKKLVGIPIPLEAKSCIIGGCGGGNNMVLKGNLLQ